MNAEQEARIRALRDPPLVTARAVSMTRLRFAASLAGAFLLGALLTIQAVAWL